MISDAWSPVPKIACVLFGDSVTYGHRQAYLERRNAHSPRCTDGSVRKQYEQLSIRPASFDPGMPSTRNSVLQNNSGLIVDWHRLLHFWANVFISKHRLGYRWNSCVGAVQLFPQHSPDELSDFDGSVVGDWFRRHSHVAWDGDLPCPPCNFSSCAV